MASFFRAACFILLLPALPAGAAFELDEAEIQLPILGAGGGDPDLLAAAGCWRWSLRHHLPFGLRELQYSAARVEGTVHGWGVGFRASSSGFRLHQETGFRLRVARSFGASRVGVAVEHLLLRQEGNGVRDFRRRVAAWRVRLSDRRTLSVSFTSRVDEISDSRWTFGLHQQLDGGGLVALRTLRRARKPRVTGIALRHAPHDQVAVLLGTRSAPRRFALGLGLRLGTLSLNQVVFTHSQLGPSHTTQLEMTCRRR